nr:hypothetical protein [Candidatus Freyarchaeota archaeon]
MKVYVPLKEKKNPGPTMWVAKVGYDSNVAFYAISDDMDELHESINEKAKEYYPGLLDLEKSYVKVRKARLGEVDLPENLVNSATRKIEEKDYEDVKIPASILVPLELELVPVVNFDPEDMDPEFNRFVEPRDILSKREIEYLNGLNGKTELTLTAKDDNLVWVSKTNGEAIDFDPFTGKRLVKELTN